MVDHSDLMLPTDDPGSESVCLENGVSVSSLLDVHCVGKLRKTRLFRHDEGLLPDSRSLGS